MIAVGPSMRDGPVGFVDVIENGFEAKRCRAFRVGGTGERKHRARAKEGANRWHDDNLQRENGEEGEGK